MRSRRALVGLVMALTAACSSPPVDRADRTAAPATVEPVTTTAPTTTTTVPVPAEVRELAATATMTERARRIFLAASPAIEDATTFAANCGIDNRADSSEPRTHTQGCYVAGRIHLLSPDRPEARELLYVVAAHELLHAVYASLGPVERSRIDAELQAARPGNQRLEERLKPYGASPTLINEVHSILGSEFESVSPTLEAHYAQFFADRAAVVAARQRTLGAREDEIARLRADIDDLDARITALRETQEELRAANDIRSYNANVAVINRLIGRYNDHIHALNARIDEYNGLLGG